MKQSTLFTKTRREAPADEVSKNAQLLIRAGFIHKEMAGVYSLLPLGVRVFNRIEQVIREEMNAIGGQEVQLSVLQDPEIWKKTNRWDEKDIDAWFKTSLANNTELGLSFTHEEPMVRAMISHISSYRDLPMSAYHFQSKFRNELRSKSGIMRGREFVMKDLYSFAKNQEELDAFYELVAKAYEQIFTRFGLGETTYKTFASGGVFSKFSHEFQTLSEAGEDTIYIDEEKKIAVNKEVLTDEVLAELNLDREHLVEKKAIEVGNIFKLGTKYSEPLGLTYKDEEGASHPVVMGSYGIGLGRLMGTVVETLADDKGIIWPKEIAPFDMHLIALPKKGDAEVMRYAEELYEDLVSRGVWVLFDDRAVSAGEKFADSDLIGIPKRLIVGVNAAQSDMIEVVDRTTGETTTLAREELLV